MEDQRFARTQLLIGREKMEILEHSAVAVFGIGGVGSFVAEALARSGIGALHLVDRDVIDITNINRQLHALEDTIGRPKVEIMARRLQSINPNIKVTTERVFVNQDNANDLVSTDFDYVVDAVDTVTAKTALMVACYHKGIPVISAMGAGNRLDPTQFEVVDISQTHTCPLARAVRKRLKKDGISSGVTVVYSPAPAMKPALWEERKAEIVPGSKRKEVFPPGSVAFVPSAAGLILASVVFKELIK